LQDLRSGIENPLKVIGRCGGDEKMTTQNRQKSINYTCIIIIYLYINKSTIFSFLHLI